MTSNKFDEEIAQIAACFSEPHWSDVQLRSEALPELAADVLLHAGPPLKGAPPPAIRQAAIEALLFEGQADNPQDAAQLLTTGKVRLLAAQDHGMVTPLAQVVSASMPLFVVRDKETRRYAPIVEGPPPALRFGKPGSGARAHLQLFAQFALQTLKPLVQRQPFALDAVIRYALQGGEECHALTARANTALATQLDMLNTRERQVILANPGFVLPLLMAVCAVRLEQSGHIVAVGGNGLEFGYRARDAASWQTIAATPPQGTRFAGQEDTVALGAIGDSAVIDFCGLGAQALAYIPSLTQDWKKFLPDDLPQHRSQLLHARSGLVDLKKILINDRPPMVNLAILDQAAETGLIGRGVYTVPAQLFADPSEPSNHEILASDPGVGRMLA